ncbi:BLUF domain-containing protein [Methyloversatilis thermotolerans]|uniref:BLUF domain-containing protein n=1 Tax=Methyloversatilis thermotolerans TaxID=1346290 RepID=UPI000366DF94|nr:BLUF domain-containing protein [Methyloversatilis thermotolerans]
MLVRLIYASRVASSVTRADVDAILACSQRNNARVGVTGALCFTGTMFLQCLEGGRQAVNEVYHRIAGDPRHRDPALLSFEEIVAREFGDWAMGYVGHTPDNRALFLKYCPHAEFDPYAMSAASVRALLAELLGVAQWRGK